MSLRARSRAGAFRRAAASALGLLLLATSAAMAPAGAPSPPATRAGCEPSGEIDLAARLLSRSDAGGRARVLVELAIHPHIGVPEAAIETTLLSGGNPVEVEGAERRELPLLEGVSRRLLYSFDLPLGREFDLLFTLVPASLDDRAARTGAYLRLNFDPARQPARRVGALEFRATAGGS